MVYCLCFVKLFCFVIFLSLLLFLFFFFQAEDGIRDIGVTGVQTCALPIFPVARNAPSSSRLPTQSTVRPRSPSRRATSRHTGIGTHRFSLLAKGCSAAYGCSMILAKIGRASCRERE